MEKQEALGLLENVVKMYNIPVEMEALETIRAELLNKQPSTNKQSTARKLAQIADEMQDYLYETGGTINWPVCVRYWIRQLRAL